MALQQHSVASSAISRLDYDDESKELFLTFTDGRSYTLPDFPEIELARWLESGSIGGYWNANVRGKY
jgi:hypothetical protein